MLEGCEDVVAKGDVAYDVVAYDVVALNVVALDVDTLGFCSGGRGVGDEGAARLAF